MKTKKKEASQWNNEIEEIARQPYPIEIHVLSDEDGGGYHVFLPDFGHSACSATGDTVAEALTILEDVKREVVSLYLEKGIRIPEPSPNPAVADTLQQVPFRIPKSTHRRLKDLARVEGLTLNAFLARIVNEFVTVKSFGNSIDGILSRLSQVDALVKSLESMMGRVAEQQSCQPRHTFTMQPCTVREMQVETSITNASLDHDAHSKSWSPSIDYQGLIQ